MGVNRVREKDKWPRKMRKAFGKKMTKGLKSAAKGMMMMSKLSMMKKAAVASGELDVAAAPAKAKAKADSALGMMFG
tara:strand:+ start:116 stop:346 length:231 start_codon:yes stop_codon:yes gene_type:complete